MADLYEYGVAVHLYKPIIKRAVVDFAVGADWTPAAGDVKISKDGGAAANVTNLPTAITMGNTAMWDYSITATEMQAAKIRITVSDSATKAVEDTMFEIDTYGNASAQHKVNLNDSVRAGLTALPNAAAEAAGGLYTRGSGAGQINQAANGQVDANVARWLNTAVVTPNTNGVPIVDTRAIIRQGTAQAGAAGSITLDSGASSSDSFYVPCLVTIISGTGASQAPRVGLAYTGSSKVLTVAPNWTTNPASDSVFQLTGSAASLEAWERVAPSALSSGKVQTDANLITWKGTAPADLISTRVDVTVGAMQTDVVTATAIATDAIGSAEISAAAANKIRDAVSDDVIETNGSITRQQAESLMLAALAGVTSGGGNTLKDPSGTATRIAATTDGSNNRTAMTVTPSS